LPRWIISILVGGFLPLSAQAIDVPAYLPRYDLRLDLDTDRHIVTLRERITWINPSNRPTRELQINFYPHYTVPKSEHLLLAKTLELLRLSPSTGFDPVGRHGEVEHVTHHTPDATHPVELKFTYREDNPTAVVVELPTEVRPGESVTVELDCRIRLPNKQGRWGHWEGVHFLAYALPTVAYYDTAGWHAMPFVPWHQPFWNEAGVYTAIISLPDHQKLACSAPVKAETTEDGRRIVVTEPFVGRDFAVVCSALFKEFRRTTRTKDGQEIDLTCLAFERHAFYAEKMLDTVVDAIPIFASWFGPFPYRHLTIVESFFGWNGNECGGLVMIDERVFDAPHAALGYVEYLTAHETSHQWWYNLIGTNGYAETFMDEGPATYFTHKMLDRARGPNNHLVRWTGEFGLTPRIRRENYRFASLLGAIRRDDVPPAAAPLPEFGNLVGLFTGAYDRGSKVFGMIESRMGEAAFADFIRELVRKYSWRILTADLLKAELEAYTGKNWDDLFDRWVFGTGLVDWSVESVRIEGRRPRRLGPLRVEERRKESLGYRVSVVVRQNREFDEPTTLGFRFRNESGYPIRVPINPIGDTVELPEYDGRVESIGRREWRVTLTLPEPPENVVIDPDRVLLDADWSNNSWIRTPRVALPPLYSLLNDTDLTNDYDRWNFQAGLWASGAIYSDPWYTRGFTFGARAGAFRTQEFVGGAYFGYRQDYKDLVFGVDGLIDHWPFPKTQVGFNYERRIARIGEAEGADTANRAVLFGRYVFRYGASLYLPPLSYLELFTTYQDNFLPVPRVRGGGAERLRWFWVIGPHYRLNLYTPYWDPEQGFWVDLTYATGTTRLERRVGVHQLRAELATVQKLPEGYGYLSDIKFAGRGVIQKAWPRRGEFFALGGSTLFRGFDLAEKQGSFLWVANAEARLPVLRDLRWNFVDRVIGIRNVYFAAFYDVGGVYVNGSRVGSVAHALGGGFRVDASFFSFIERATVRFDFAKTLNAATPFQFWFGVQHPF
jgi:hypothetical protein